MNEKELEEKALQELKNLGYEEISIKNEEDLKKNFQKQFLKYNLDNQIDKDFIDINQLKKNWFDDLISHINNRKVKNVLHTYDILRKDFQIKMLNSKNKSVRLNFFDDKNWCKNLFQVGRQVKMENDEDNDKKDRYFDLVLFINGLPLVLIELKKKGSDLRKETSEQIEKYSSYFIGLFRYIEIFIISNGISTEYFANQKHLSSDNKHIMQWSELSDHNKEFNYKVITQLDKFIGSFLDCCRLAQIIAHYIVFHEKNEKLLIMRPHQIHAIEKLLRLAKNTKNNGYIWHTTGSGKTATSFVLCDNLRKEIKEAKIFFLTDRKELDSQTFDEFSYFKKDSVKKIEKTHDLKKHFEEKNPSNKIVLTLIHKMNNLVKKWKKTKNTQILEDWKKKKIFFIIDECHRTQSGDMHENLKNNFPQARFFGFTGTPFSKEHIPKNEKSTQELFGDCEHTYTMFNALKEKNKCILPFRIRHLEKRFDKEEQEAKVKWILKNHYSLSKNKKYNALLVTQNIEHLLSYYNIFKKHNENSLKIATIFSQSNDLEESSENLQYDKKEKLDQIIKEYKENANINNENYHQTILKDMKDGTIDILIVVEMFLTGFDSPRLNTLYVDRVLKTHKLFQAFSRTIRKDKDDKVAGDIVCFQTNEDNVKEALKLYAKENNSDSNDDSDILNTVIVDTDYKIKKDKYIQSIKDLKKIAPTPEKVNDIIGNTKKENDFIQVFFHLRKNKKEFEKAQKSALDEDKTTDDDHWLLSEEIYSYYDTKYKEIWSSNIKEKKNKSISRNFEKDEKKYKEDIDLLKKIAPTPSDVVNLEEEDVLQCSNIIKHLKNQNQIMKKHHNIRFHENNYNFSLEDYKKEISKEISKIQNLDIENIPSYTTDVEYLEKLFSNYLKQKIITNKKKLKQDIEKREKPYPIQIKIEEEISKDLKKNNQNIIELNNELKKLFKSFIEYLEKNISSKYKDISCLLDNFQKNDIPKIQAEKEIQIKQKIQAEKESREKSRAEKEIQAKADELCLPSEDLEKIIEEKQKGEIPELINKYIVNLLKKNPEAINKYKENKDLNGQEYGEIKISLKKDISSFIESFCKKYPKYPN